MGPEACASASPLALLKNRHVLVLGLGISGLAAAKLAVIYGAHVVVLDEKTSKDLEERAGRLRRRGADVRLEWNRDTFDGEAQLVVVSPGVRPASLLGRLAAKMTCPVIGELELGFLCCSCPVLAITGTNGKTTTTELTAHILKHAGRRVTAAGNVGYPLCDAALSSPDLDFAVVEVSSFQLETCYRFAPLAVAYLNFTSDHIDRYGSAEGYFDAKLRIFRHVARGSQVLLRQDLLKYDKLMKLPCFAKEPPLTFAVDQPAADTGYYMDQDGWLCCRRGGSVARLLERRELKLIGRHNVENVLSAIALADIAGVPRNVAAAACKQFAPSPHRLELVNVHHGVKYINDSKATNPDSVIRALEAVGEDFNAKGKIHLIAGGQDKDMDFSSVTPYLKPYVKEVYLIGDTREMLAGLWGAAVPCRQFNSLVAAVEGAIENATPGSVVLLSPGNASFDMFANYAERGQVFTQAVRRRLEG